MAKKYNNINKESERLINEMKQTLKTRMPKLTLESLVFDEAMDDFDGNYDDMPQGRPAPQQQMMDNKPFNAADDEKVAQNVSPIDGEIKPLIDQIRVLALQGVAKLANNPTSPSYDTLKRVWMLLDKAAENAAKEQKQGTV